MKTSTDKSAPLLRLLTIKRLARRFTGFALLAAALLIALLMMATGPQAEPSEQVERAWPITVMPAEPTRLAPVLHSFGRVEAQQTARINSTLAARVIAVFVREGDTVSKGDLLITLDESEVRFELDAANARVARARATLATLEADFTMTQAITAANENLAKVASATLQRAKDLHARRMIADAQFDAAVREASQGQIALAQHNATLAAFPARIAGQRATVQEAIALAQRAEFDLAQTQIRAPFSGRILASPLSEGERVTPGAALVALSDQSSLEIRATLPAATASKLEYRLRNGKALRAHSEVEGKRIDFTLSRIGGAVRSGQGGLDAFFSVPARSNLDIGEVIDLNLQLPTENNVLAMPIYSLYENNTVYRVRERRLEALTYERVGDYINDSGDYLALVRIPKLAPGDSLLGSQLSRAISGLLVAPITADSTQQESI